MKNLSKETFPIDKIDIPPRLRNARTTDVAVIAQSIASEGLLHPIVLRRTGKRARLIAGLHRLDAVKSLGWTDVGCVWMEETGDLELDILNDGIAECDENLFRAELVTSVERAPFTTKRAALTAERLALLQAKEAREKQKAAEEQMEKAGNASHLRERARKSALDAKKAAETAQEKAKEYAAYAAAMVAPEPSSAPTADIRGGLGMTTPNPPRNAPATSDEPVQPEEKKPLHKPSLVAPAYVVPEPPKLPKMPSGVEREMAKATGLHVRTIRDDNALIRRHGPIVIRLAAQIRFPADNVHKRDANTVTNAELASLDWLKTNHPAEYSRIVANWKQVVETGKYSAIRPSSVHSALARRDIEAKQRDARRTIEGALTDVRRRAREVKTLLVEGRASVRLLKEAGFSLKTMPEEWQRAITYVMAHDTLLTAIIKEIEHDAKVQSKSKKPVDATESVE